jgi:ABC-type proline/glycine betaine transport system permease subunit
MFKFTKVQRWMLMLFKLLQTISHLALFFVAMAVAFGAQVYPKMIGYTPPVKKKTTNVQAEGNLLLRIGCLPLGFSTLHTNLKAPLSQNVHQCLGRSGINGEDGI